MLRWIENREEEIKNKLKELETNYTNLTAELKTIETVKEYMLKSYIPIQAEELFNKYIKNIEAYCNWSKLQMENGEQVDPDEKLMRNIEEKIGISENAKKAFREEILIRISSFVRKDRKFDYTTHDRLYEAILKALK